MDTNNAALECGQNLAS